MPHARLIAWARRAAVPVDDAFFAPQGPLRALVGDARIVSLGEGLHGAAEPLDFRNRLFTCLATQHGFGGIALESGLSSALALDDYVHGAGPDGEPEARALAARGITSGLGGFPQQAALLRWMRQHNAARGPGQPALHFFGMDTSALPVEPASAMELALAFLDRVDPPAARALRERLAPALPLLGIDRMAPEPRLYALLPPERRDAVTAAIADLLLTLEVNEPAYGERSTPHAARQAALGALGARQADAYLRQFPPGWSARDGFQGVMGSVAVSDLAKADNVDLHLRSLGDVGRLMLFSHLGHAASTAVGVALGEGAPLPLPPLMGSLLRRRHGARMVVIGHLFAHERCHPGRDGAEPGTLEAALASLEVPAFVLDLRHAPAEALAGLRPVHALYGQWPVHSLSLAEGVDVLLFTRDATPAR